jgi:hypothetical protein
MRALLLILAVLFVAPSVVAQTLVAERQVTWRSYAAERSARVRTFPCDDERRPTTIVVDDAAANGEPVTVDAQYVADLIAREVGVDPTAATFVFRFSPAAFTPGADDSGKTLLLRATFRRLASGGLGSPEWRVITPDALAELTDRALR